MKEGWTSITGLSARLLGTSRGLDIKSQGKLLACHVMYRIYFILNIKLKKEPYHM